DSLTHAEWEALCDGCGKCCLLKLEDEDSGEVHYTNVACRLFDATTGRCGQYALRQSLVPSCVVLSPTTLRDAMAWMPATCAYRRRSEGLPLPAWHPLLTGDPESPAAAGHALRNVTVPEWEVAEEDLQDHIWPGIGDGEYPLDTGTLPAPTADDRAGDGWARGGEPGDWEPENWNTGDWEADEREPGGWEPGGWDDDDWARDHWARDHWARDHWARDDWAGGHWADDGKPGDRAGEWNNDDRAVSADGGGVEPEDVTEDDPCR
ncbi:MAG: YcgN family cysteine cluster protein, partial [Pseudomonadota bacterium]